MLDNKNTTVHYVTSQCIN